MIQYRFVQGNNVFYRRIRLKSMAWTEENNLHLFQVLPSFPLLLNLISSIVPKRHQPLDIDSAMKSQLLPVVIL